MRGIDAWGAWVQSPQPKEAIPGNLGSPKKIGTQATGTVIPTGERHCYDDDHAAGQVYKWLEHFTFSHKLCKMGLFLVESLQATNFIV